jgi:hypothetical protein
MEVKGIQGTNLGHNPEDECRQLISHARAFARLLPRCLDGRTLKVEKRLVM